MKVFVAFGYQPSDLWIRDLIFPLIQAIGGEVLHGEDLQGQPLNAGVRERISQSDVLLAFLTRRGDANQNGEFDTHTWVSQEVAIGIENEIPVFEIFEEGVKRQAGIAGDRQYYFFKDKAKAMIEVAKFVSQEKDKLAYKTIMLLPEQFSATIGPHIKFAQVSYKFMHRAKEYEPETTTLKRLNGGIGVIIKRIPHEEAFVEINVTSPAGNWNSGFVSVALTNVHLIQE